MHFLQLVIFFLSSSSLRLLFFLSDLLYSFFPFFVNYISFVLLSGFSFLLHLFVFFNHLFLIHHLFSLLFSLLPLLFAFLHTPSFLSSSIYFSLSSLALPSSRYPPTPCSVYAALLIPGQLTNALRCACVARCL